MNTKKILLEMPHIGTVNCPYCDYNFYADAMFELFPVDKPQRELLFAQYLKYKRVPFPCPKCHKDIVFDTTLHKTFKYDELIDKVSPNMAEYLKTVKFYTPEFITMDKIVPEHKEHKGTNLSFGLFSKVLDESEKSYKGVISFDFDDTIGLNTWDKEENDFKRGMDGYSVQRPNLRIIELIKQYIAEGYKVVLVTSRFEVGGREDVVEKLKKWNVPIDELHFTNGYFKANTLKRLHAIKHYDDDREELKRLRNTKVKGILVNDNDY